MFCGISAIIQQKCEAKVPKRDCCFKLHLQDVHFDSVFGGSCKKSHRNARENKRVDCVYANLLEGQPY